MKSSTIENVAINAIDPLTERFNRKLNSNYSRNGFFCRTKSEAVKKLMDESFVPEGNCYIKPSSVINKEDGCKKSIALITKIRNASRVNITRHDNGEVKNVEVAEYSSAGYLITYISRSPARIKSIWRNKT